MTRTKNHATCRDRLADCCRNLTAFIGDQAGASFVITALAFPVVLGMAGLGIDAAMWYQDKRQNQTIADNASVAGRIALSRDAGISESDLEIVVRGAAADNGFVHGTHGAVTVNNPPLAGPNVGDANFVEVVIAQSAQVAFSAMIVDEFFMVRSRAVSGVSTFGNHCVVALDETADGAVTVSGGANLTSACGIASNSSSDQAVLVSGNATLVAEPVQAYGDIDVGSNATVTYGVPPQPLSERVEDPYAGVLSGLQADPSCAGTNKAVAIDTADLPVSPGRYCGGIKINQGDIVFLPGTYYIDNGSFTVTDGTLTGDGVTFILTAMDAGDLGNFSVSGGTLDLRAPTAAEAAMTGGYEGMLFIQDPFVPNIDTANNLSDNKFTGGSTMILDGALYFPMTDVEYSGGSGGSVNCTLIVSRRVALSGNAELENDANACLEAGITSGIQQTRVRIME